MAAALVAAGILFWEPLVRAFTAGESSAPTERPGPTSDDDTSRTSEPSATALPAPTSAPEPTMPHVEGTWGEQRVLLRYAAHRDGNQQTLDLHLELGGVTQTLRRVRAVFEYYVDHRKISHDSGTIDTKAHRLALQLPRNGKYHVSIQADADDGALTFTCDVCVGGLQRLCPKLRARCSQSAAPSGHDH